MPTRTQTNRWETFKFMVKIAWPHRRLFLPVFISIMLFRISVAASNYAAGGIAGAVQSGSTDQLRFALTATFVAYVIQILLNNLTWWFMIHNLSHLLWGRIKEEVIREVTKREPAFFQKFSSEIISSRINDTGNIAQTWRDVLLNFVMDTVTFTVNTVIVVSLVPVTIIPIFTGVAVFFATHYLHQHRIAPLREIERDLAEKGNDNAVIRLVAAANDLIANNAVSTYAEAVIRSVWSFIDSADDLMWKGVGITGMLPEFIAGITLVSVYALIGNSALNGEINVSLFFTACIVTASMFDSLWSLASFIREFSQRLPTISRVMKLLGEPEMYPQPKEPKSLEVAPVEIELVNVSFTYPERNSDENGDEVVHPAARSLLKRLGIKLTNGTDKEKTESTLFIPYLKIRAGETIALVGPSGGGKSTLIKLILGLVYPDSGQVLINGIPTTELGFAEICKVFGTISQGIQILDGSIAENVLLSAGPYTEEQEDAVIVALQATGFWDLVKTWPNNLYEQVGSKGITLSGGQRQMLALARMLIKRMPNLILDEATAALDMITERIFGEAVRRLAKNGTKITIAHRLASIIEADRILVISDGKIVEEGNHLELLSKHGVYHRLWNQGNVVDAA